MVGDVVTFHQKFNIDYDGPPRFLDEELQIFRNDIMMEELDEYFQAVAEQDPAKMFDSLIDLMYVVLGTARMHGFPIEKGWAMVHFANMCKVKALHADQSTRKFAGDIIKPPGWVHPDLSKLVFPLEKPAFKEPVPGAEASGVDEEGVR